MEIWRPSENAQPGRYTMVYGMIIGALVVALAWYFLAPPRQTGGGDQARNTAASSSPNPSAGTTTSTSSVKQVTPLVRCQAVAVAQQVPLDAARAAMLQWQVHIAAMNKLVLGVITLQQATQFWAQTRVDARHRLTTFFDAQVRYDRQKPQCPLTGQASGGPAVQSCKRAIAVHDWVLHAAHKALATWSGHVMNMNMLRNGTMSPTQATTLWLKNWHAGQHEVNRYRAMVHQATTTPAHC